MPRIQKVYYLEITPEQFLNNCSPAELAEIEFMISTSRFQERMEVDCPLGAVGCPYHECYPGTGCQRRHVIANGGGEWLGECEKIVPQVGMNQNIKKLKTKK